MNPDTSGPAGDSLRILIVPFPGTWSIEGGHHTQQLQTAVALRRSGALVAIGELSLAFGRAFDVVHYFGDPRPLLQTGRPPIPLIVSPVYFPSSVHLGPAFWEPGRLAMARQAFRHRLRVLRHRTARRAQVNDFRAHVTSIAEADVIVVNSHAEGDLLRADSRRPPSGIRVVHSGVDEAFFHGDAAAGRLLLGLSDGVEFVLCVGRPEPRKNQLTLAKAMNGVPYQLVLVGAVLPGNEGYLAACRSALPSLIHVPAVPHELLPHVYRAARVHVLASWYETTGLSTLEAMAAGTPVVVGDSPTVEEYFGGHAEIAKPGSVRSLRQAISAAFQRPAGQATEVAARYSWARTAAELLTIYRSAHQNPAGS